MAMDIIEAHSKIENKNDLANFIAVLRVDYKNNPNSWENRDLESFLDAMHSWVAAMENYYRNHHTPMPPQPTWKMFADILMGARIYE